ncbi:Rrf2 family transcriptional regulator [Candidatus Gracilibacteria bacterium]|nr:Rrf2 family transcriptional regulator [Candidatus Gracilibacteria bacterium]
MIKLSQTGDDALKALCYIADKGDLVQIREIVESQGMSETCLRRIIPDLHKAGILIAKQGRGGGVMLASDASQISLYDIFLAVGEEIGITDCTKDIYCEKKSDCYTTDVLGNLQRGINSLLKMQTLDKIIKK